MRDKVNLTEVSNELFDSIVREREGFRNIEEKEYKQFMSKNAQYLKKILEALTIRKYEKFLKPGFDITSNGYSFNVKDMEFLKELLNSFTEKQMLELRRGHMENVPDRFLVWIVEGMYKVFLNNNVPNEDINKIAMCMSNMTNYPVRKRFCDISDVGYELEKLASNVFKSKWMTNLNGNDNCIWLDAFNKDARAFLNKWAYIYNNMSEVRCEEVNNLAEEDYYRMTDENTFRAELDWHFAGELSNATDNDKILKDLIKKRDDAINSKTGFDTERFNYIENMSQRISQRLCIVEEDILKKHLGDVELPKELEIKNDSKFDNLMDSEEVLKQAIEDYKESRVSMKFPLEDIPDIDFDELRKEIQMYKQLKKRDNSEPV